MRRRFLYVQACLAGLGSLYWADPDRYGSLLAGQGVPREGAMQDPLPEILSRAGMETQLSDFETYKGIGLHAYQSESRLKVVRAAVDEVYWITNPLELERYVRKQRNPPEARLFAFAKLRVIFELSVETQQLDSDRF